MKLLTKEIEQRLRKNAEASAAAIDKDGNTPDHVPVLKVFNPYGAATWLFTELHEDGLLFGLCDLGMGSPELGYVSLDELKEVKVSPFNLPLERDAHFTTDKPLSVFTENATARGRIVS